MPGRREKTSIPAEELVNRIHALKKKIQLSEGQKKAQYEECEEEKKKNNEKIQTLKKDIKRMYEIKRENSTCVDALPDASAKSHDSVVILKRKKYHEALDILDGKLIDVKKKTDLIRHDIKQKRTKLNDLFERWSDVRSKINSVVSRDTDTAKSLSALENRSHQVDMSRMEASHVTRKYRSIKNQLLQDSVVFDSTLDKLEKSLDEQQREIQRLQKINEEAVKSRDKTRQVLHKKEVNAANIAKFRMRQVEHIRAQVEERKLELEKLERKIFPPGQRVVQQDSVPSSSDEQRLGDNASTDSQEVSDTAYMKLKQVTGSIDCEDVRRKFVSQKETKDRLTALKTNTEKEKNSLQMKFQQLNDEFEQCRFSDAQEKEQNQEETELLKQQILEQQNRLTCLQKDGSRLCEQINRILVRLYDMCLLLREADSAPVPDKCPGMDKGDWLICLLQTKYESVVKTGEIKYTETDGSTEQKIIAPLWTLGENVVESANKLEEEEEKPVPNRYLIKKQAQLVVDSKSKKKGFRMQKSNL
ncbi:outer dynein arm-docking complex subunit 3 [Adelges cooleyi]|uniref:outer dynein arm-docking complex subunit 3 n=1 Tax=Adelges cooleyi TaxID=133065 RepID=UPI00217F5DDB|nr:outer dynein arm-docking complex subunit 3 [Adelges cooleyi]